VRAWAAWVRHDAGRRWRGTVLLAVFVALAGGVALSAVVGARRDATSYDRLAERTHPATVMALPNAPGFDWTPAGELPYVRAMQTFAVADFGVAGHPDANVDFPHAGPAVGEPVEQWALIAGRLADPARADEVTISPHLRDSSGVAIGDELTFRLTAPEVITAMLRGETMPDVAPTEVRARVVGVAKGTFFGGDVHPTLAFYERHEAQLTPPGVGYVNAVFTLEGGEATIPRLEADLQRIAGRPVEMVSLTNLFGLSRTPLRVESTGLLTFGLAAFGAALVFGAIAVLRVTTAASSDVDALRGLGFTSRQTVTATAATPAVAVTAGAVSAAVVAYALSDRYPIGGGRYFEPTPGRHANVTVLAAGVLVCVVIGVGGTLLAARRAVRRSDVDPGVSPSHVAALLGLPGATMPFALGAGLATERRRGAGGPAVTAALLVGVTGIVAALTFAAGLDRGTSDGLLAGQPIDSLATRVGASDLPADVVEAWRADDRVASAARIVDAVVRIDDRPVAVFAVTDLKGRFEDHPLRGRVPTARGEIGLAPKELAHLGIHVGDTVRGPDGSSLRVVGELFTPETGHTGYSEGARVTPGQLDALVASGAPVKFDALALRWSRHLEPDEVAEVWRGIDNGPRGPVDNQRNLESTHQLPRLFAALVAVLSVAAAAYGVHGTARRRRREVAVLQVLGLTRRQARLTVWWHVAVAALVALAIGVPLGFAIGRTLWQSVADALPIRYATPTAWLLVTSAAAGLLALVALVASRPVHRTARDEPATLLRAE
jgi:FtsX-like permease family